MTRQKRWCLLLGAGVLAVLFGAAFQKTYLALILCRIGIYIIAVSGLDILFGYTGQISFGHAAFFAIGAYTSAILSIQFRFTPVVAMVFGSLVSVIIGILIAIPASKLVKHFLSLLTIAFGQLVFTFVNSTRWLTGGASGLKDIPAISIAGYELDTYAKNLVFIFVIVVLVMLVKKRIVDSRTGRAFIAVRENVQGAYSSGINVRRYKIMAFAISAGFTGLAGGLYAHLIHFISPDTFNSTQSTLFMTILLFGGMSSLAGPVIGSVILLIIREVLQGFATYQLLIYAIFILIVLYFLPTGMVGLIGGLRVRLEAVLERRREKC